MKRLLALILSFAMLISAVPIAVFAQEQEDVLAAVGLCPHHSEHTDSCGYLQEGSCGYICEECVSVLTEETEENTEEEDWQEIASAQTVVEETVAEETSADILIAEETYCPGGEEGEEEILLEGYLYKSFYGDSGISLFGVAAYNALDANKQCLYNGMKSAIEDIAAGRRISSVISVDVSERNVSASSLDAAKAKFAAGVVLDALLHDCPYELYWYDKTSGTRISFSYFNSGGKYTITNITLTLPVVKDLRGFGYQDTYPIVDLSGVKAAQAAEAAQKIVASAKGKTAYEKLKLFHDKICDLTSYNTQAAATGKFSADADPWQLLWVFDGDPSTKVVCEGYAKAFQYLCDLDGTIDCYTVTGQMGVGNNYGGHMWNIVTLDNRNYLMDVTNGDTGSIGSGGELFLAGAQGSADSTYIINCDGYYAKYSYDNNTRALWGNSGILTLSSSSYSDPGDDPIAPTKPTEPTAPPTQPTEPSEEPTTPPEPPQTSGECGENLVWNFSKSSGRLTISGSGKMDDYQNGGAPWAYYAKDISSVRLSDGITNLGDYAFAGCEKLRSISIYDTDALKIIGNGAFYGCKALTSLSIHIRLDKIGDAAFANSGLKEFTLSGGMPKSVGNDAFKNVTAIIRYPYGDDTFTSENMLQYGGKLTWKIYGAPYGDCGNEGDNLTWSLDEKTGVLTIAGTGAMYENYLSEMSGWAAYFREDVTAVVVADGVTTICAGAFESLRNLETVTIADTVTKIGMCAFQDCGKLSNVTMSANLQTLENSAFNRCVSLKEITFYGKKPEFGASCFQGTELTVKYPSTWGTEDSMPDLGGKVTWKSYFVDESILSQKDFAEELEAAFAAGKSYVLTKKVTLEQDMTVAGKTCNLEIREGGSLTVSRGVTMTMESVVAVLDGEMTVAGTLNNYSELVLTEAGTLNVTGEANNLYLSILTGGKAYIAPTGKLTVAGKLTNNAVLVNEGILYFGETATVTSSASAFYDIIGEVLVETVKNDYPYCVEMFLGETVPAQITLYGGMSILVEAKLQPRNVSDTQIVWASSNEEILTLRYTDMGVFLQSEEVSEKHTVYVTASSLDGLAKSGVLEVVILPEASALTIESDRELGSALAAGEGFSMPLYAKVQPEGASRNITWTSSDPSIARVEPDETLGEGNARLFVTGKTGAVKITASTNDNSRLKATWSFKVVKTPELEVIGSTYIEMTGGTSQTLSVKNKETGKKISSVQWSIGSYAEDGSWMDTTAADSVYATISTSGKLTAKKVSRLTELMVRGQIYVEKALAGEILYSVKIYPAASGVDISQEGKELSNKTLFLDTATMGSVNLAAKLYPLDARQNVTWKSSSEKIAVVKDGIVTPVKDPKTGAYKTGTVTVTATAADGSGVKASVKIEVGALTSQICIGAPSATLVSGKSMKLTYTTEPLKPSRSGVTWKILEGTAFAKIDSSGKLTALAVYKPEQVTIQAESKDAAKTLSDKITVTILPKTEETLNLMTGGESVTKTTRAVAVGDRIDLSAWMFTNDPDVAARKWNVTWKTSNAKTASLSALTGQETTVTVHKAGSVTITASGKDSSGKKVTATVTLKAGVLSEKVSVTSDIRTVASGKSITLKAAVYPANVTAKGVNWWIAKGSEYASITSSGKLTAVKNLMSRKTVTVAVQAKDGSSPAVKYDVTVTPLAQSVDLWLEKEHDSYGAYSGNVTGQSMTWPVRPGESVHLYAFVYPGSGSDHKYWADQDVEWKTSNKAILDIDRTTNCVIFGGKTGSVTVTATAKDGSGKKATLTLKVVKPVTELDIADGVIGGGKTLKLSTLTRKITPDATSKKLRYTLEGGNGTAFVTLTADGQLKTRAVTTKKTVTITARDEFGFEEETFTVSIYPIHTKLDITVKQDDDWTVKTGKTVTLQAGQTLMLEAAGAPKSAYTEYTWTVSNGTCAAFEGENGAVEITQTGSSVSLKGLKAGKTVTVTVKANDGSGKKATVKVKLV